MAFTKSTVTTNNISALANQPTETAVQLKAKFDQYGVDDKVRFNALIDELEATTGTSGAENIGSKTIAGVTGNTIWSQISDIFTKLYANFLSKTNTTAYSPTAATHPATKGYVDTVAADFELGILADDSVTNAKLATDIKIGSLALLETTDRSAIVPAVNEIKTYVDGLVLETNTTFYVDGTLGNDSNDGRTSGAGAFKTVQFAVDSLPKRLDADAIINVAEGIYSQDINVSGFVGAGSLYIKGAVSRVTTHTVNSVYIYGCSADVYIYGFVFSSVDRNGIEIRNASSATCKYCTVNASTGTYDGATVENSNVYFNDCEFSNRSNGVYSSINGNAVLVSVIGTGNVAGLRARYNGSIGLYGTGNTITGTTPQNTSGGLIIPRDTDAGILQNPSGTALPATTGTMTVTMDGKVKTIVPTGACTFNATVGLKGDVCSFRVQTSGVTSYVLTFGTNFKSTGTLTTGTVTVKYFTVNFVCDGNYWLETSRTVAM